MTNETSGGLERLSWLPGRDASENGIYIAGQSYYDVEFTGGAISNVTLTDVTINGTSTARTETIITASGGYTVQPSDYVITVNKTIPEITTITLPASPTTSRSIIVKDGQGQAANFNITINGNGKTIDGVSTLVLNVAWQAQEIIFNGTEWNIIGTAKVDGDVVGPVSSTDNAIARFDGTTGRAIQNSVVTIADSTGVFSGASIDTASAANVIKINGTSLTAVSGTGAVVLATGGSGAGLTGVAVLASSNTFTAAQNVSIDDATTNTVTDTLILNHSSSGTPAASFGTGIKFTGESTTTNNRDMGRIQAIWTTATDASRATALQFQTLNNAGALTTNFTIAADGAVTAVSNVTSGGSVVAANASSFVWTSGSRIKNSSDGVVLLQNNGSTDFSRLQFGGTTSSFPSLARSTTTIRARLADDSGFSPLSASTFVLNGSSSGSITLATPAAAGSNTITFPAGTTDFSATGGTSQVVKQTSAGGAFTVGQLAASDFSNGTTGSGAVVLANTPTLITPVLGAATGTSFTFSGVLRGGAGAGSDTIPDGAGSTFTPSWGVGTTSGVAGFEVNVHDGTNNRRVGLICDNTNGVVGISYTYSVGLPTFVIRGPSNNMMSIDGSGNFTFLGALTPGGTLIMGTNNITSTGSLGATGARLTKGWFTDAEFTNAPTVGGSAATGTGGLVRANTPTLVTPVLGAATATSINFGGTSLSNYVEGTFTPTIVGTSTAGAGTYSLQSGKYTRIGNTVTFAITLQWSAHTGTGNMNLAGLPFTINGTFAPTLYYENLTSPLNTIVLLLAPSGGTVANFTSITTSSSTPTALPIDTAAYTTISGSYFI